MAIIFVFLTIRFKITAKVSCMIMVVYTELRVFYIHASTYIYFVTTIYNAINIIFTPNLYIVYLFIYFVFYW